MMEEIRLQVHNWGIILGYLDQHSWKCVYTIHTSQPREITHTEENTDTHPTILDSVTSAPVSTF